ncbi:DUF4888 domain-containing protein, partial [Staphylococcus aureus]|nr:DUF4888 domain-containing protein [Staphylococcus aureus]
TNQNINAEITKIEIERKNPNYSNINTDEAWKKLTKSLKEKNLVKNGAKVSIYSKDPSDITITGKVGDSNSNAINRIINPKDITHITVENN